MGYKNEKKISEKRDTWGNGKPPIRVLMYQFECNSDLNSGTKMKKKISEKRDAQRNGKPPIRVLMYQFECNSELNSGTKMKKKSQKSVTHIVTENLQLEY